MPPTAPPPRPAPPAPAAIPGYGLAVPTEADVRHAIRRHFGADETARLWDAACRGAGIRRSGRVLLPDELMPIATWLAAQDGVLRAVGQSLAIRLRTYRMLAAAPRGGAR